MPDEDRIEELEFTGDHWSHSKLSDILDCGHKYYLGRVLKAKKERPASLIFGSVVHKCLEEIEKTPEIEIGSVQRLWLDSWHENASKIDWQKEDVTRLVYKNRGMKMLEKYIESEHSPAVSTEIRFKGGQIPVQGTIDKIVKTDKGPAIIDYKTSKYPMDPLVLDKNYQFTFYFLGAQTLGYDINHFAIHHLLSGKLYWTYRDWNNVEELKVVIDEAQRKIDQEMFSRNVGYLCKYCVFKEQCLGGQDIARELPSTTV